MRKFTKLLILFLVCAVLYGQASKVLQGTVMLKGRILGNTTSSIKVDSLNAANYVVTEKMILDIAAGSLVLQDGTVLYFTDGTEADSAYISHDGTDLVITGDGGTTALELEGLELELSEGATIVNTNTSLLTITEATVDIDGDFTAGTVASDGAVSGTAITGTGKISTLLTTEQLRLSYDASNYATWTVASDGALTLVTVDAVAAEGDINLNPDGYVGIKTAIPTVELDVTGAGKFSTDLTVTGGDVTGANGNFIDIGEATDGTMTFGRDDAGAITLTSVDSDANADLTVSAGGSGALTLGDVGSTAAISSSDWTISTAGVCAKMGSYTFDNGAIWDNPHADTATITEANVTIEGDLNVSTITDYGLSNHIIGIGDYTNAVAATMDDHFVPMCINVSNSANVAKWLIPLYVKAATNGDQASMSYAGIAPRLNLDHDVTSGYGIQSHLTVGTEMAATGEIASGSYKTQLDANVTSTATVYGLQSIIAGTGSVAGNAIVFKAECYPGATVNQVIRADVGDAGAVTDVLFLSVSNQSGTSATNFVTVDDNGQKVTNFLNVPYAGGVCQHAAGTYCKTTSTNSDGALKISVGGAEYYIPIFTAANTDNQW